MRPPGGSIFPAPRPSRRPRRTSSSRRNRPLSALISDLGPRPHFALESFGDQSRFPVFFPFHPSPDPALNRETRRLSMPDRKFSLERGRGGYSADISRGKSG